MPPGLIVVPGFGPLVFNVLVAAINNGIAFRKGRYLSAWRGLGSPAALDGRQVKVAGHQQGGQRVSPAHVPARRRFVVAQIERNPSALSTWLADLPKRTHRNVAVVDFVNMMARIAWAVLNWGAHYYAPATTTA